MSAKFNLLSGSGPISEDIPRVYRRALLILMGIVIFLSFLDLIGWIFNIAVFKSIGIELTPMKIITAICFILSVISIILLKSSFLISFRKRIVLIIATFISFVSILTILDYIQLVRTGNDMALANLPFFDFFLPENGRMAFVTSINFVIISFIFFRLSSGNIGRRALSDLFIIPVLLSSYFVLVSYILGVNSLHVVSSVPVALNTSITFLCLCFAFLIMYPESWLLKVFISEETGYLIARKLMPTLMILPVIIGWLRIKGEVLGVFKSNEGVVVVAVTYTLCFIILIWLTSRSVNTVDRKRQVADEALRKTNEELLQSIIDRDERTKELMIAEKELQKTKNYLENLINYANAPIIVWDPDTNIQLFNHAFENLTGYISDEVSGKKLDILFPKATLNESNAKIKLSLIKKLETVEIPIMTKNNEVKTVLWNSANIYDTNNKTILSTIAQGQDITSRLAAEKELQNTKNYLENLINYANAPIIVWNPDTKIQLFNHAFENLTGYCASDVIGKQLDILFPKPTLDESNAKIKVSLIKKLETVEIPIMTKDDQVKTVLWNSANIHDTDNKTILSTIAQGQDITSRLAAEKEVLKSKEKLDLALENGNIGIWELDKDMYGFSYDKRLEKMFRIETGSGLMKFSEFENYIHEEDKSYFHRLVENAMESQSPIETVIRTKSGKNEISHINIKAITEKDSNGDPLKISGVCFDITEMKKGAEKTLFLLNEELTRSNRELEQFAYVASHDLQEPLRMVSSFTQMLARRYKDKLDNDANEFIQFAVDGASRMQNLINDLLEYSRVGTRGKNPELIDMHTILGQAINNLGLKIKEKNALITNDDLPEIYADGRQMQQLLQNLIDNALKFSKSSPIIHVSSATERDDYLFSVEDNGIGIEPQYYGKIFQIFQRLHAKEDYPGTGIGLAICRRIVERHGGKIWLESKPGEGTKFFFTIIKHK